MQPDLPPDALNFGVVLLAAGASSRMGQPKLLLPWGSTSVLGHLVRQWRALQAFRVTVVHAPGDEALRREFDRLQISERDRIANAAPARGMFSSIQAAA